MLPHLKPDFVVVDVLRPSGCQPSSTQFSAFIEVKATEKDRPMLPVLSNASPVIWGIVQLRHDTTVQLLVNHTYYDLRCPRFKVAMGGSTKRHSVLDNKRLS
jgi:hypothetical protein